MNFSYHDGLQGEAHQSYYRLVVRKSGDFILILV